MVDPYELFGIDKNATQDMLKQRYRGLVQKWHEDKYQHAPVEEQDKAKEMFALIQEAWRILGDPDRRKLYDDTGFVEPGENEISRSVETTLRALITNYLTQGERIFTIDIIKEINRYCDAAVIEAKNRINKFRQKKVFLLKVIKKFTKKKKLSRDFLNNIFLNEFNSLDQAINGQLKIILLMTQVKSVINAYEFDFMQVIEGPVEDLNNPPNRVPLGNIFELAGVNKNNGR